MSDGSSRPRLSFERIQWEIDEHEELASISELTRLLAP